MVTLNWLICEIISRVLFNWKNGNTSLIFRAKHISKQILTNHAWFGLVFKLVAFYENNNLVQNSENSQKKQKSSTKH